MPPTDFRDLANGIWDCAKDAFGIDVTYKPKAGGTFKIRGIFDNAFEQVDPDTEQVVAMNQPILGIKNADMPFKISKGDIVIIEKTTYRVVDSQEDGVAGSSLLLHKVANR